MSYRIYLKLKIDDIEKDYQAFGNNECPKSVIKEFKKQGAKIDKEDRFEYFEIKDLNGLIKATEKYIKEEFDRRKLLGQNMADFSNDYAYALECGDFTYWMSELRDHAYIFASAKILDFIGITNLIISFNNRGRTIYQLNEGVHLFAKGN